MEKFPKGWLLLYSQKYVFGVPSNTVKFPFKITFSGAEKNQNLLLQFKAEAMNIESVKQRKQRTLREYY